MQPISRVTAKQVMTVDEAVAADRKYFDENPNEEEYIRDFVPGKIELPEIPEGFRYATHVCVNLRVEGQPVGRFRRLMAVCEGEEFERIST